MLPIVDGYSGLDSVSVLYSTEKIEYCLGSSLVNVVLFVEKTQIRIGSPLQNVYSLPNVHNAGCSRLWLWDDPLNLFPLQFPNDSANLNTRTEVLDKREEGNLPILKSFLAISGWLKTLCDILKTNAGEPRL